MEPKDVEIWSSLSNTAHGVDKARPLTGAERSSERTVDGAVTLQQLLEWARISARWSFIFQIPQDTCAFYLRGARSPSKRFLGVDRLRVLNATDEFPMSVHAIQCASDRATFERSAWNGIVAQSSMRMWLDLGETNVPRRLKFQTMLAMQAWRRSSDALPEGDSPIYVRELATKLRIEPEALRACLHTASTPRCLASEVEAHHKLLASPELPVECEAGRLAIVAALTLGPAAVENMKLSLMGTKESLADPLLQAEFDTCLCDLKKQNADREVAYSPGFPGTEDGECLARHLAAHTGASPSVQGLATSGRAYLEHQMWGELVEADVFQKLATEGARGREAFCNAVVDVENKRKAAKDPTPSERRRYQGTEDYVRALSRLASFDWGTWSKPTTSPPPMAMQSTPPPPPTSPPIVWDNLKEALLKHTAGEGFGPFIADKVILGLLLTSSLSATDGGSLGPGAISVFVSWLDLIRGDGWRSAYKFQPSEAVLTAEIRLLLPEFFKYLRPLFRLVVRSYWAACVRRTPVLAQMSRSVLAVLDLDHPEVLFENMMCELQRRRAAGVAWARGVLASLPKGKVKVVKLKDPGSYRTNENLRFLVLLEGHTVRAVTLQQLLEWASRGGLG